MCVYIYIYRERERCMYACIFNSHVDGRRSGASSPSSISIDRSICVCIYIYIHTYGYHDYYYYYYHDNTNIIMILWGVWLSPCQTYVIHTRIIEYVMVGICNIGKFISTPNLPTNIIPTNIA